MTTLTVQTKPNSRKINIEIDIDQWERLADVLGFYRPEFLTTLKRSLGESKRGKVEKIKSLRELASK
jgi:hypothetical protein